MGCSPWASIPYPVPFNQFILRQRRKSGNPLCFDIVRVVLPRVGWSTLKGTVIGLAWRVRWAYCSGNTPPPGPRKAPILYATYEHGGRRVHMYPSTGTDAHPTRSLSESRGGAH